MFPDVPADNHLVSLSVLRVSESQNQSEAKRQGGGIYKKSAQKLSTSFSTFLERLLTLALEPTSERFFSSEHSLVNCRMEGQINRIRSVMSEDCVVLLEELIQSNRDLAAENEKLRQEHEKTSKHQAEALNRIEQRLKEGETPGILRRRARPGARAREARNIAVPAACRVSIGIAPFNQINTDVSIHGNQFFLY